MGAMPQAARRELERAEKRGRRAAVRYSRSLVGRSSGLRPAARKMREAKSNQETASPPPTWKTPRWGDSMRSTVRAAAVGVEVEDVFEAFVADGALGKHVHGSVAGVGGVEVLAEARGFAGEDVEEAGTVEVGDGAAAGGVDEGGGDVGEGDHGPGDGAGGDAAGPAGDEGDAEAGVVEGPLGAGPFGALVGGVDGEGVLFEAVFAEGGEDFAEVLVGGGDVLVVVGEGGAGFGGVDGDGGKGKFRGVVVSVGLPEDVGGVVGEDEAEGLGGAGADVIGEEGVDGFGVEAFLAVSAGAAGDIGEGCLDVFEGEDFDGFDVGFVREDGAVAEGLEVLGDGFEAGFGAGVVAHEAVAGGMEAGVEDCAGGAAGGGGGEGAGEAEAFGGEAVDVGGFDGFVAVAAGDVPAVVVGEEEDDVRGRRRGEEGVEEGAAGERHGGMLVEAYVNAKDVSGESRGAGGGAAAERTADSGRRPGVFRYRVFRRGDRDAEPGPAGGGGRAVHAALQQRPVLPVAGGAADGAASA